MTDLVLLHAALSAAVWGVSAEVGISQAELLALLGSLCSGARSQAPSVQQTAATQTSPARG